MSGCAELHLTALNGSPFSIQHAGDLAEFFFRANESSAAPNGYDEWTLTGADPCRIRSGDIAAVNRTMAARTAARHWESFTSADTDEPWLCALDQDWDLFATPEEQWLQHAVQYRLGDAFKAVMGPYRGAAVTTKVLHIKRPRLIPVCDSYVARMLGVELWDSSDWRGLLRVVLHLRKQGQANLESLQTVQAGLQDVGIERTLVRILDALLWMRSSSSGPYHAFVQWLERVNT